MAMEVDGVPFVLTALPEGGDHVALRRRGELMIVADHDVPGRRMHELARRYGQTPVRIPQQGASSVVNRGC